VVTHVYAQRLTVRHEDGEGDGRTLVGLAVPYGVELDVSDWWDDYTEVFRLGSFKKTIRDRKHPVPLLVSHDRTGIPIGAASELHEQDDGLHAAFHLTEGIPEADHVLAAVKADTMTGLSIGFQPVTHTVIAGAKRTPPSDRDLHERTEVILREVSVCNFPAYPEAGTTGVRAGAGHHPSLATLGAERQRLAGNVVALRDRWGRVDRIRTR